MPAPCHSRSEDLSLFLAKYAFQLFECTNTSSPYLFQTDLILPNISNYLRRITAACWTALILPFLGQKEQTNHTITFDSFVTLPGHSLTATGHEVIWGLLQLCCSLLMRLLFVHKCRWLASQCLTVLKFVLFPLLSITAEILLNTSGDFIT